MNHNRSLFKFAWLLLAFLICGCGEKKPVDDIVLIKQFLTRFERGISLRNQIAIDSLLVDKKTNLSTQILDSLSIEGMHKGIRIISKSFIILEDSAEVRLTLGSDSIAVGQEIKETEKQIRLYLYKKRGNWKIRRFSMESDNGK
jgi:hypothetical protein